MWNLTTLEKARAYELVRHLGDLLCRHYPWLMGCTVSQVLGRLAPVRHSQDFRWVRYFGVDCPFENDDECRVAGFTLRQFMNGTPLVDQDTIVAECDLPVRRKVADVLKRTVAYQTGLLRSNGEGQYGWYLPEDEAKKPTLVIIPSL